VARRGTRVPAAAFWAVGSAFFWSLTAVIGRVQVRDGMPSSSALLTRFAVSAVLLVGATVALRRPLAPARGERLGVLALGFVGYGGESTLYFLGLERGSAAAVSLLFYTNPGIVMLLQWAFRHRKPHRSALLAFGVALCGVVLVASTGSDVSITKAGAFFALAAATTYACYLLVSERVVARSDPVTVAGWLSAGATVAMGVRCAFDGGVVIPADLRVQSLAAGIAAAVAFALLLIALGKLGAGPTSMLLLLELVCVIVLSAVFLDETLSPVQLIGGALIALGALIIVRSGATAGQAELVPELVADGHVDDGGAGEGR
jgi:drug/metabolite transporter (DMT)-like permease